MVTQAGKVVLQAEKKIDVNGEERILKYEFCMPMSAPFGISYDIAHEFLQEIVKMAKEASDRAAREEKEEVIKS